MKNFKSITAGLGAIVAGGLMLCAASTASANVIMLSGDGNISNNLPTNASNQSFFTNVLQGGSTVVVHDNFSFQIGNINNHYNGLGGVSSSLIAPAAVINAATLTGVDLYVATAPIDAYTGAETTVLMNFLSAGGSIFFLGDNAAFAFQNGSINAILGSLGSGMSIIPNSGFDNGFQLATGGQIAVDPFTAGVTSFSYASSSQISGGTQIIFGRGGEPFIAYENVAVPEPGTLGILGLGLAGLGFARRHKAAQATFTANNQ